MILTHSYKGEEKNQLRFPHQAPVKHPEGSVVNAAQRVA